MALHNFATHRGTRVEFTIDSKAIRNNRLAMLQEIDRQFLRLADFLQIVREGE